MAKLTVKQKQWLIATHVIIGSIWFGTALCMVLISIQNRSTTDGTALYTLNTILKYLDDYVVIPAASLSLFSGAILCTFTIWGFFKHYWVIAKWIATVTLIVTGTIWLGPWVNAMTAISEAERIRAWENPLFVFDQQAALWGGAIQTLCILGMIVVSFVKPWGRRLSNVQPESEA